MVYAVFLDRDGVLNGLILNPETGEYEPPHIIEDMKLFPYAIECLEKIQDSGYDLFLISNQPDYAKGKTTFDDLEKVHKKFDRLLTLQGIYFREYYYCFHHPRGIISEYACECMCRKPKPFFLFKAEEDYNVELRNSWMIGDRDTDIECGKAGGTKTILIEEPMSINKRGRSQPDYKTENLMGVIDIILPFRRQK